MINSKPNGSSSKIFKKILLGMPSELYFMFRYLWLLITIPKKYFDKDEQVIHSLAIVYVHGLFGTSYEFIDINNFLKKKYPLFNSYYFSYSHGQSLHEDIKNFNSFIEPLFKKHEKIIFIGHSRGATICKQTAMKLDISLDRLCLILIGEPSNGSYVVEFFNNFKRFGFLGRFLKFLIRKIRMEKAMDDFNPETMKENDGISYPEHHLIGLYDVISKPSTSLSKTITFFPVSHLGLVISNKVFLRLYELIKAFIEQD